MTTTAVPDERLLTVGTGEASRNIAVQRRAGGAPGLFWVGGYRSNMNGTKALAMDALAAEKGLAATRFDYSGHGQSEGRFEDGTISLWLEDARAVFATTEGPQIVVGSSMGGWIGLHLAELERATGRIVGLVLIAPAVDMTKVLISDKLTRAQRKELRDKGILYEPNPYGGEPTPITRALVEDGERHLFGDRLVQPGCPVHILQGMEDVEVPFAIATGLVERLASDDVVLTLIKDGDHRLSRPEDIERLRAAILGLIDLARA
jgi:pimeloyl-ACP methyl ester carboxylesterase